MPVAGKSRSPISFLAKPKICGMRPVHSRFGHQAINSGSDRNRKPRFRKATGLTKYDVFKKSPDYTDVAYREAVSRLRYLLNESYFPQPKYPIIGKQEESDDESGVSIVVSDRTRIARLSPYRRPQFPGNKNYPATKAPSQTYVENQGDNMNAPAPPELMAFIQRQEDYIEQLEKESQYCRDELSQLLGKVKDLITENETLHEQQNSGVLKAVFEGADDEIVSDVQPKDTLRKRLEGPLIVFESRISELEAQLTQTKIDLRKAQEETEMYRKKLLESDPSSSSSEFYKQIQNLQREKRELNDSLIKLQASVAQIREKEIDASKKVQRTLDVVDKTQFEKQQAEMEVNRLKSELEHQHDKLLKVLSDQTRKVTDERGLAERRYLQHVEQLNSELAIQRDATTKLQLELEKHLRIEEDLRRDLTAKNMTIESVKKELNNKIACLQGELTSALTERDSLEQELSTNRMSGERSERLIRQESSRLQVEITSLRQRLDRADSELMHARRENLRLAEQIAAQEKEITLYKIKVGEGGKDVLNGIKDKENSPKENELNSRISDIEAKHIETVSELEGLIENQSQVMAQLKAECQSLTQKLEESTARHKQEMADLQSNLEYLTNKLESTFTARQWEPPELSSQRNDDFQGQQDQYGDKPPIYGNGTEPGLGMKNMSEYSQKGKFEQRPYKNNSVIQPEEQYAPEPIAESYATEPDQSGFDIPDNQNYSNSYHQPTYDDVNADNIPNEAYDNAYQPTVDEYQPETYDQPDAYQNGSNDYTSYHQQQQQQPPGEDTSYSYDNEQHGGQEIPDNYPLYQSEQPSNQDIPYYAEEQPTSNTQDQPYHYSDEQAEQYQPEMYPQTYETPEQEYIQPSGNQGSQDHPQPSKTYQPAAESPREPREQPVKTEEVVRSRTTPQSRQQKNTASSKNQRSQQIRNK